MLGAGTLSQVILISAVIYSNRGSVILAAFRDVQAAGSCLAVSVSRVHSIASEWARISWLLRQLLLEYLRLVHGPLGTHLINTANAGTINFFFGATSEYLSEIALHILLSLVWRVTIIGFYLAPL